MVTPPTFSGWEGGVTGDQPKTAFGREGVLLVVTTLDSKFHGRFSVKLVVKIADFSRLAPSALAKLHYICFARQRAEKQPFLSPCDWPIFMFSRVYTSFRHMISPESIVNTYNYFSMVKKASMTE